MKYVELLEKYGDYFTIQVGAFSSYDNAQELVAELKAHYEAYMEKDVKSTVTIYRVRVGRFNQRAQAQKVCERLSSEGYPAIVYP